MNILETRGLTFVYGAGTPFERTALNNVDISIASGEIVGIIGHTGSGKSTLIQHFNGLLKPMSGEVLLDGKPIWNEKGKCARDVRFRVGLVFQYPEYQLFEETVARDIFESSVKIVSKLLFIALIVLLLYCLISSFKVFLI